MHTSSSTGPYVPQAWGRLLGYDRDTGRPCYIQLAAPGDTWEQIIPTIHRVLWLPLMEAARRAGEEKADAELGDPNTRETQAFYAASEFYLKRRGISFSSIRIPATRKDRARLLLRFPL